MTDTSVIEASSVGIKTMADGTLRLTIDVEPRNAQAAFKLFGSPGTPMAVAALKPGAKPSTEPGQVGAEVSSEPLKGGAIAKWLAIRGQEPEFQQWLRQRYDILMGGRGLGWGDVTPHDDFNGSLIDYTTHCVKVFCEVGSRREIDNDPEARERFERLIRKPWLERQR